MDTISKTAPGGGFLGRESNEPAKKGPCVFLDKVLKKTADIPQVYRQTYKRAMTGKSLRAAINAFCLECVQWQREEIKLCTAFDCPLYPYRPYQKSDDSSRLI